MLCLCVLMCCHPREGPRFCKGEGLLQRQGHVPAPRLVGLGQGRAAAVFILLGVPGLVRWIFPYGTQQVWLLQHSPQSGRFPTFQKSQEAPGVATGM